MRGVRALVLTIVLRVAVLVALATSASLLIDYLGAEAAYCSSLGCMGLRRWGYLAGGHLPMPLVGVVGFGVVLAMSLWRKVPGLETMSYSLAATGGIIAVGLIGFQLYVGRICLPCMVTDGAAIVAGIAGGILLFDGVQRRAKLVRASEGPPRDWDDPLRKWTWVALGVLAVAAPLFWPWMKPGAEVPAGIREYYVEGKINVVEFSDFQCGHCRDLHPRLKFLVDEYGERVNYVRLNTPLSMHRRGRAAARAVVCAEHQGDGEEMADELFRSDLQAEDLRRLSLALGLDDVAFGECLEDASTDARIDADIELLSETGRMVTPTVYVGSQLIRGSVSNLVFRDAFDRAERGDDRRGVPGGVYFGVVAVVVLLMTFLGARDVAGAVLGRSWRRQAPRT